jgi:nucleotide-binding universal stress UspA family protein
MRRILVVANQTLLGDELLGAVQAKRDGDPEAVFHLLVPATHPRGAWSEGSVHAATEAQLAAGKAHFAEHGIEATGEIGDANPIQAVNDVMLRQTFDEIIVSTLPPGPSHWLRADVPSRIRRHFSQPVIHVEAKAVDTHAIPRG